MLIPSSFICSTAARLAPPTAAAAASATTRMSMVSSTTTSFLQSVALPVVLSVARGGAELFRPRHQASGPLLDMARVRLRLEGLQAYATLCALLTNGCLRLYSSVPVPPLSASSSSKPKEASQKKHTSRHSIHTLALDAFLLCIVISVLFGSYTTIVFTLLALYSKTALGRGYDQQFLDFFAATANLRESGFQSFLYSLVSFELAFILSLFLKFEGNRRKKLVLVACFISAGSVWRWSNIMHLATVFLFPLKAEIQY